MARRPKAIGTAAESAVRDWLIGDGWTDCHRTAQTGATDTGDLLICTRPRVVAEVKGGAQADQASAAVIDQWLAEADVERRNAGAVLCPLVVRRRRRNTSKWDVWLPLRDVVWLDMGVYGHSRFPVRMSLADLSDLLRVAVERGT